MATLGTTPEPQWDAIRREARRKVLDDVNPLVAQLSREFEVLSVLSVTFDGPTGLLDLRFPGLDTGDFQCQIRFELGAAPHHSAGTWIPTNALKFKLMASPSERYFAGNWRKWGSEWMPTVEASLRRFFETAKTFHEQRTKLKTRKPKVEAALKRQPVPKGATVTTYVQASAKGVFQRISRTLTLPDGYTEETYVFDYENEALVLKSVTTTGNLKTIRL